MAQANQQTAQVLTTVEQLRTELAAARETESQVHDETPGRRAVCHFWLYPGFTTLADAARPTVVDESQQLHKNPVDETWDLHK